MSRDTGLSTGLRRVCGGATRGYVGAAVKSGHTGTKGNKYG